MAFAELAGDRASVALRFFRGSGRDGLTGSPSISRTGGALVPGSFLVAFTTAGLRFAVLSRGS